MRAGIAFGSNVGDRAHLMRLAKSCVLASVFVAPPALSSSLYATSPVDCPPGSEEFFNGVMEVTLTGDPLDLLRELRDCERGLGRSPSASHHAPRCIDLDLLYAGDRRIESAEIVLPHPRMTRRRFVLAPLAEIRPDLVLPGQNATVAQLLRQLPAGDSAEALHLPW